MAIAPTAAPSVRAELLDAEARMELTEKGWIEKVVHPAHGRMSMLVVERLLQLGVPARCLYDNTRLDRDAEGLRYVPDLFVVLPDNPVPIQDDADYAGAPDLVIEILSPGDDDRQRDLEEKRRRYALRGIPHYWIVDPATGLVTRLGLMRDLRNAERAWYHERRPASLPLEETTLPWRDS